MALSKSNLLIRDYENIRPVLRDIYIFGCFSRDDFIRKGMSGRKYDNEQRRISSYLPDKFVRKRRVDKKVILYCSYDMGESARNYLAETYRNKSFTALDIMSFFFIQQLLNETEEMTAVELLDKLPALNHSVIFTKDNLRVKLDELVESRYITSRKDGRNVYYGLASDIWSDFTNEELEDICIFLEFLKNVSPLEMPYYFLEQKLHLYLECERGIHIRPKSTFAFKHSHLFNCLDNDILLGILKGCEKKTRMQIKLTTQKSTIILPIYIIHDSTYGRQYLYCYDYLFEKQRLIRIDKVESVEMIEQTEPEDSLLCDDCFLEECWCTSGVDENLKEVVIAFFFDEEREDYILRRIQREGHSGTIEKINDGVYEYRIKLRDPNEMIPWIRSFGERAKVLLSEECNLDEIIAEDWKKAVEKYETIR